MALDANPQSTEVRIERLRRRYDSLKSSSERTNCESHWQDIAEICSPRKLNFVGTRTPGEKRMNKIYDSTGVQAVEMLAAGLHGMATNPASKWFSLRMVGERTQDPETGEYIDLNDIPEVQQYLSDVEEIMWARVYAPGTNFTTALHEVYLDLAAFGTGILFVGQQRTGGLLFECRPLAECLVAEGYDGKVDTVFRKFTLTVRQMIQLSNEMGWRPSEDTMDKYRDQKYDETVEVVHAVYPREERDPSAKNTKNMEWASCYFEREAMHELEETGFEEFPYQVARWSKYAPEVYGRGPGMTALPDLKMLQAMTLTKIKLAQKNADPPLWLKDDGMVGPTRTIPGGINYWRGNPNDGVMLQPTSLQGWQYLVQDIEMLKEQIRRTFYADLMRMAERPNMTATEVVQRTSEMMRLFGPLIGRLESEMLGPLIERVFGILSRETDDAGKPLLPTPPDFLGGKDFTVEFVSPVATAQKQAQAESILQVMNLVGVFGPEMAAQIAGKNLNVDKMFRWLWDLFNNDPDLLQNESDIQQRDQMAQASEALGMGQQGAALGRETAGMIKDLAAANASGGMDIGGLMQQFAQSVQQNPQAQQELQSVTSRFGQQVGYDPEDVL